MVMNLSKLKEIVDDRGAWHVQSMGSKRVGYDLVTKQHKQSYRKKNLSVRFLIIIELHCAVSSTTHWIYKHFLAVPLLVLICL